MLFTDTKVYYRQSRYLCLLCTCCAPAVQGHIGLAVSVTLSFMSLHIKKPQSHVVNSGAKVIRGTTQIQEQVLLLLTDAGR